VTEIGHAFTKIDWEAATILFESKDPRFRIIWDDDCLVALIRGGNKWVTTAWLFPEARKIITYLITANDVQEAIDLAAVLQVMQS
jgi:hypothetical protein